MRPLLRGSELVGLPVVTLGGDDIAEVRDVVFDPGAGLVLGFTLNKRGMLAGRLKEVLPREGVHALGPNAIMVASDAAFDRQLPTSSGGNVLGNTVLTDSGVTVGTVTDVVVDTADGSVVGYEMAPSGEPSGRHGRRSYLPLPDTGAASGEKLIVPASAVDYVADDLAGFADSVDRFRDLLRGGAR